MTAKVLYRLAGSAPVPLLSVQSCSIRLGGTPIVRGVDFEVERGSCIALLGPNGSGKTTLLRAVGGVLPHGGQIHLDGRPVRDWPKRDRARRVAFVRQTHALSFDLRVRDLVALGRTPHKRLLEGLSAADHAHIEQALQAVELEGFEERSARSLSGGELQRVFLAQALAQEAGLLLLDEPTAHLDVHSQYAFWERLRRLAREGRTVLAAAHDLELAGRYADRLLVLHPEGRLAADGPPAEVLTPGLMARVFRMDARLAPAGDPPFRVHYRGPLAPDDTFPAS